MTESMSPYEQGSAASESGQKRSANPHARDSHAWSQWIEGFEAAEGVAFSLKHAISRAAAKPPRTPLSKPAPKAIPVEDRDWERIIS